MSNTAQACRRRGIQVWVAIMSSRRLSLATSVSWRGRPFCPNHFEAVSSRVNFLLGGTDHGG